MSSHPVPAQPSTWPANTLLGTLEKADREALLALGTTHHHNRGETLTREGDRAGDAFVILRGCVKVLGDTRDGHTTLLAIRASGDVIGELSAIDGWPRSATTITAQPTVTIRIGVAALQSFLSQHPRAALAMHRSVAEKLRQATRLRIDLGGASVLVRLIRILHNLAIYGRECPEGLLIDIPLSQGELAALLGAAEPSVQRCLAELRRENLIITGYRRIIITDLEKLRALATDSSPR
jgi:CRP-like cAMP-binding protein